MDRKDLDRPDYGSYEEVHEKLVQAMQDACMEDRSREYRSPDIDMSFLYEETAAGTKKIRSSGRFNKVAAIVIIALLSINAVLLISDSNEVYSEKGLLHRIYEGARGIFTDEDPSKFVEMDETGEVFIINDMKNIDKAKEFWPDLCVPGYIPNEYEFTELQISKLLSGECSAVYRFYDRNNELKIGIYEHPDKILSNSNGKTIHKNDRVINYYYDHTYKHMVADIFLDDLMIIVQGQIHKEEILNISNNIQ